MKKVEAWAATGVNLWSLCRQLGRNTLSQDMEHFQFLSLLTIFITLAVKRQVAALPSGCQIKGNIGKNGRRLYHVPGSRSYDQVKINEKSGERYFCSEQEAVAAGWTRASQQLASQASSGSQNLLKTVEFGMFWSSGDEGAASMGRFPSNRTLLNPARFCKQGILPFWCQFWLG